jgi:hypothetical protein
MDSTSFLLAKSFRSDHRQKQAILTASSGNFVVPPA